MRALWLLLVALALTPADVLAQDASSAEDGAASQAGCSADALPTVEHRHLEAEYAHRMRRDGKRSADAWVHEQGKQFHRRLAAQGICPPPTDAGTQQDEGGQRDTDDGGCRMVMRPVAGFGGAMTMAMVPDCSPSEAP